MLKITLYDHRQLVKQLQTLLMEQEPEVTDGISKATYGEIQREIWEVALAPFTIVDQYAANQCWPTR